MGHSWVFSGFSAIVMHLIGDVLTFHRFRPLYPFSDKQISFGLFPAGSKSANDGFLMAGCMAFVLYIFVSVGAFDSVV